VYSTCIFCHGSLGKNEVIEHLPLGRRLAYDPARGRLWVVCRRCARWNLSPLETRWEAIEEAERAFRATPIRISTDNIGLARLAEGLELVRIGEPPRIELAGWRYGDQFGRRRRRNILIIAGLTAVSVAPIVASLAGLAAVAGVASGGKAVYDMWRLRRDSRQVIAVVRCGDGTTIELTRRSLLMHGLEPRWDGDGWRLHVSYRTRRDQDGAKMPQDPYETSGQADGWAVLTGIHARRILAMMLPTYNGFTGGSKNITSAVDLIGVSSSLDGMLHTRLAEHVGGTTARGNLGALPASVRLALEMVLHDDDERRALDGEMQELEARWREAEVVAAIADGLLLPSDIDDRLTTLRSAPHPIA
jgi:hypothetical protein